MDEPASEPMKIYALRGLPNGQTVWLTVVNALYTEREDAEFAAEFFRGAFPSWQYEIDTYVKEGE